MDLENWLRKTVPVLALRAFAEDMPGVHDAKKADMIEFILRHKPSKKLAERSLAIEQAALSARRR